MILFAFDRDYTVNVGAPPGPIPVDLVRQLAKQHECWAIGNQRLVREAGIKGMSKLWNALGIKPPFPPTRQTADEIKEDPESLRRNILAKRSRLLHLAKYLPDCSPRIVVDDLEIHCNGWWHYTPEEFVELADAFGWRQSV